MSDRFESVMGTRRGADRTAPPGRQGSPERGGPNYLQADGRSCFQCGAGYQPGGAMRPVGYYSGVQVFVHGAHGSWPGCSLSPARRALLDSYPDEA